MALTVSGDGIISDLTSLSGGASGMTVSNVTALNSGQFGWRNKIINGDMNIATRI